MNKHNIRISSGIFILAILILVVLKPAYAFGQMKAVPKAVGQVDVSWDKAEGNVKYYNLYRSNAFNGKYVCIASKIITEGSIIDDPINNEVQIEAYVKAEASELEEKNDDKQAHEPKFSIIDGDVRRDYGFEGGSISKDGTSYEVMLPYDNIQNDFSEAVNSGRTLKFVLWFDGFDRVDQVEDDKVALITIPKAITSINLNSDELRQKIVDEAMYWNGKIPYCFDNKAKTQILDKNNPPAYLDCSGFTSSVFKTVMNIDIGSSNSVQITRGSSVKFSDLKPGDLILFDWPNKKGVRDGVPNHTGIYLGNNNFINETGSNTNPKNIANTKAKQNVRVYNLNADWGNSGGIKYGILKNNICAIRRIIQDDNTYINKFSDGAQTLPQAIS